MRSEPPAAGPRPAATLGKKLLLVVFGLLLAVLLLAAVEGVLALFGIGDAWRWEDPFVTFAPGRDLFAETTLPSGERVWATRPDKLAFFNQQQFPVVKSPGTVRVFALGGSTTFGRPYDARVAFPRRLGLYLGDLDPGRRWEVINAGGVSYASYRVVVLMRELLRHEPDVFVVYTGHNEFLEERTYEGAGRAAVGRLRAWLSGRRFYALARHAWLERGRQRRQAAAGAPAALPGEVDAMLDTWTGLERYHRDDDLARAVTEHFAANLRTLAALARSAGAELIFVVPASNLRDFSPFKSEHRPGLPDAEAARAEALLAAGREALAFPAAAGDEPPEPGAAAALGPLTEAREIDPLYAETWFRLGRAYLELGRVEEAREAFVRARDLDVAPLRATEALTARVAGVAESEGVPAIDLPALLADQTRELRGHPIPGDEIFLDHVHPDLPTHGLIAERLIAVLAEEGMAPSLPADWPARRRRIDEREEAALDREYYARRDLNLAKVLGWAGKLEEAEAPLLRAAEVLDDDPEVAFNLGVLRYQKDGRYEEAEAYLRRALELAPGDAEAHFNLGVVLAAQGRVEEGLAALREALRLRPDYPEAQYNLGVLEGRLGEAGEEVAALERAVAQRPRAAEAHARLGLAYRRQGRSREAVEALEESLRLAPGNASVRTELGITHARRGDLAAAARELEGALALDSGLAEAHFNLGLVRAGQGRPEEAEAAYRAALSAEPNHARARNNLGILLVAAGRVGEGVAELERAVEAEPGWAEAWFNLGVALDNAGRPEEALAALERAVALDPEPPRFHWALGMLYQARGEPERARPHLDRAAAAGFSRELVP